MAAAVSEPEVNKQGSFLIGKKITLYWHSITFLVKHKELWSAGISKVLIMTMIYETMKNKLTKLVWRNFQPNIFKPQSCNTYNCNQR